MRSSGRALVGASARRRRAETMARAKTMYEAETDGVHITVTPRFVSEQSDPDNSRFFWAYQVVIRNKSPFAVQLITRHWTITDGNGAVQDVRGPGVVGEQPIIAPGDQFQYVSGCPLTTPTGMMVGIYEMRRQNGEMFDAQVPMFSLDSPYQKPVLH